MRRRSKNLTKALRRSKYLLALVVLFGAGAVASGALGMVSLAGGDTTTAATDSTPAGDTTTDASTTTDAASTSDPATTTDAATTTATPPAVSGPSITTDRDVYSPGDTVKLSGAGCAPGERIHLFVNDNVGNTWSWSDDLTADLTGSLTDNVVLPWSFVATYSVTATGGTSGTVSSTFFDDSVVIGGPASANTGETKNYTGSQQGSGCTT